MIYEDILKRSTEALIAGDKKARETWSFIIGELQTKSKRDNVELTDTFCIDFLRKYQTKLEENIKVGSLAFKEKLEAEIKLLEEVAPKKKEYSLTNYYEMIGDATAFTGGLSSMKDMGKIMKYIKENHPDADMKTVQGIVKDQVNALG